MKCKISRNLLNSKPSDKKTREKTLSPKIDKIVKKKPEILNQSPVKNKLDFESFLSTTKSGKLDVLLSEVSMLKSFLLSLQKRLHSLDSDYLEKKTKIQKLKEKSKNNNRRIDLVQDKCFEQSRIIENFEKIIQVSEQGYMNSMISNDSGQFSPHFRHSESTFCIAGSPKAFRLNLRY